MPTFTTTQIYDIVNETVAQAIGTNPINVVNTQGLISLGDFILSNKGNTDAFLNELPLRIGRTIFSFRAYENKLRDMVLNDFEWGAILQKIKVQMPAATEDYTTQLEDGKSIDPYIVSKPKANVKLFYTRTPYDFFITIQRRWLKEAFLSEVAMGSFINYIFGEVKNKIELALESLGRTCMANYMCELWDPTAATNTRIIDLVSQYNALTGSTLTAASAQRDADFLRYAIAQIDLLSNYMEDMSTLYNDGTETRHTPKSLQKIRILTSFEKQLETVVQYAAFNENYVKLNGYMQMNFWQSQETPDQVQIERASDGTAVTIKNIIGFIYDRDALGIYQEDEEVLTTPVNARGSYYNTFWHEKQMWFNDMSENAIMFTLN